MIEHIIIYVYFTGPPCIPDVSYANDSLNITAYSHTEFPVQHFDVEITDITGIPTDLSRRYNVTSVGSLLISLDSSVCLPLLVSVNATNAIGTNATDGYSYLPSSLGMTIYYFAI